MEDIIISSGRVNPHIDPVLVAWEWPIPLYLFLGGLAAGILFFSSLFYLRGRADEYRATVKITPMFVPALLTIGLLALLVDLSHVKYFWKLFTTIRLESPMSWGAWTLGLIVPLSALWAAFFVKDIFPNFNWPHPIIDKTIDWFAQYQKWVAWSLAILAVILGIYTGILISAFNARPIWNTAIMGPLFLASGLSTGLAFNLLFSKSAAEKKRMGRLDLMMIAIELAIIAHMFMGFLASTQQQIYWSHLFLGGELTTAFWIFVVALGLLFPAVLELAEMRGKHINVKIPALFVLAGGLILRFIIVEAGQISTWLPY